MHEKDRGWGVAVGVYVNYINNQPNTGTTRHGHLLSRSQLVTVHQNTVVNIRI